MNTESVIKEVRIRECLWNVHHKFYKNKIAKRDAWKEVCEIVSPDYSTSSNPVKHQISEYNYTTYGQLMQRVFTMRM